MENKPKLKIGWFSFTCCEDSTILLTEMLNKHLDEWKKVIEFKHFKALKSNNSIEDLDVAFVEGAISSPSQETELQKIRANCKYLVTIGACACTGQPSASRNRFVSEDINEKISYYMCHFDYSKEVKKIADFVKVDDEVNGCPMNPDLFVETMGKYLKLFNIV
jgi:coenzyme F420-reducing hydrogenase gamma subunit